MIAVLTEKSSVAHLIADAIGATLDRGDWFEGAGYCVTWSGGRLVDISAPTPGGEWRREDLPVIPEEFTLQPLKGANEGESPAEHRLEVVRRLFDRAEYIVEATEAGREGEGLFRNIYEYLGCGKPFLRFWPNSLTREGILEAWGNLMPGEKFDCQGKAARVRAELDWLIGINASRAASVAAGGAYAFSAGRVITPVLAMICERYNEFVSFNPDTTWKIRGEAEREGVTFEFESVEPFSSRSEADRVASRLADEGYLRVAEAECERRSELPPLPYDLACLQKEANWRYSMTASEIERSAQRLFLQQLITYPSSESRYITEKEYEAMAGVISVLEGHPLYGKVAKAISRRGLHRRCVSGKGNGDHSAILVTGRSPEDLEEGDMKIYDLILQRTLEAFCPEYVYDLSLVSLSGADHIFSAKGKAEVSAGWKCVAGFAGYVTVGEEDLDEVELSAGPFGRMEMGDTVALAAAGVREEKTRPKPLLTDATLLTMMEEAGRRAGGREESRALRGTNGIGTPSTRADAIDTLIDKGYVTRDKSRKLSPTTLGLDFHTAVKDLGIAKVDVTARTEELLSSVEQGFYEESDLRGRIRDYVTEMTGEILESDSFAPLGEKYSNLAVKCPSCGAEARLMNSGCQCPECGFQVKSYIAHKRIPLTAMKDLLEKGETPLIKGFRSKKGNTFDAVLELAGGKVVFNFDRKEKEEPKGESSSVKCPRCADALRFDGRRYCCPTCGYSLYPSYMGVTFTEKELSRLAEDGYYRPDRPLKGRSGNEFHATVLVDGKGKYSLRFDGEEGDLPKGKGTPPGGVHDSAADEGTEGAAAAGRPGGEEGERPVLICPTCGRLLTWGARTVECSCGYCLERKAYGHVFTDREIEELTERGMIGPLEGLRFGNGKRFTALVLADKRGTIFHIKDNSRKRR